MAYQAARIVNHHHGFEVIRATSQQYQLEIDLSEVAKVWTNGCIIRSTLMESCVHILKQNQSLLEVDTLFATVDSFKQSWKEMLKLSMYNDQAVPVFVSGLHYWISMT